MSKRSRTQTNVSVPAKNESLEKYMTLSRQLLRIGKSWPPDILRPRLQYGEYLVALAQAKQFESKMTPKLIRSQQMLVQDGLKEKVGSGYIRDLLANEFDAQYALSEKMLHPASFPNKYAKLVGLLEEAIETNEAQANGQSKGEVGGDHDEFWPPLLRSSYSGSYAEKEHPIDIDTTADLRSIS
ncbi:122_t:CDS:2 [Acaulospora colombiana]|uniref:122_t:CDS:1 n=1 Tax=Acaulospora colombiana TaxID=27376 RepID=A0ACA9PIP1_9GLOM|nr:122_t:CDS:2 [Acaulospora colombiana]